MTKPRNPNVTAEFVRSILDYDPKTGIFLWKFRPERADHRNKLWTGRVAGTEVAGYIQIEILRAGKRTTVYAHRLAWIWVHGAWPVGDLDHIDGVRTNNRIANLREATRSENARNRRKRSDNKTGFTGVAFRANRSRWEGRITVHGKTVWRKLFISAEEANTARMTELSKHHGEFARIS